MGARDYYFSNKAMPTLGRMWILKLLQDATSSGGGGHLLGSVVQEAREGGLLGHWGHPYPVPMLMSTAGVVIGALENNRSMLGLAPTDPVVLSQRLAASLQTVTVGRDEAFSADVGPFPSLPATFGVDVDYAKMVSATIDFGNTAQLNYIPLGYLGALYAHMSGDARAVDQTGCLAKNYVVDSVLVATDVEVTFTSTEDFKGGFDAKLSALASIPAVGARVSYQKKDNRTVVAKVSGGPAYLAALGVSEWDELNLR